MRGRGSRMLSRRARVPGCLAAVIVSLLCLELWHGCKPDHSIRTQDEDAVLDALFRDRPVIRTLSVDPSHLPVTIVVRVGVKPGRRYSSPQVDFVHDTFEPGTTKAVIEVQALTIHLDKATVLLSYNSRGISAVLRKLKTGWGVASFDRVFF